MLKKGHLLSNTVVLGISAVISKMTAFLMMPIYTAALSPASFGTVDILVNTAVLLIPLVSMGAPEAVFRFLAGGGREADVLAVGRSLLGIGGLLLLLLIPLFWLSTFYRPFVLYLFCYVALAVFHSFVSYVLRARGEYTLYAVQQLFCTLTTTALAFLFLKVLSLGERGYLMSVFLADGITALILSGYLFREREKATAQAGLGQFGPMIRYALPLIPTATLWWALAYFDHFLLLRYFGAEITGVYAAAAKFPALLTFAVGIFLEAWHYAALHTGEGERGALFERIYAALVPVLLLFSLMLILCAPFLVELLLAADFVEALHYVPILTVAAFFSALSSFLGSVYMVKLRSGASLMTALVGAAVNLLLGFLWIPTKGAEGAMLATLCAYLAVFLWRAVHCRKLLPFRQVGGKLAISSAGLLLTAYAAIGQKRLTAVLLAVATLLPFVGEMRTMVREMWQYGRKICGFSTKKAKRS